MFSKEEQNLIESLFYKLVSVRSDTNTIYEPIIEDLILNWFKQRDYFTQNPDYVGTYSIPEDALHREVVWALVKGTSEETIVLINHHDAIGIEEFGKYRDVAFRPDELKEKLKSRKKKSKMLVNDIENENWIFGRGTADMKGGVALQMGLIDKISKMDDFKGNVLFISVPDEETISKGAIAAVSLMDELSKQHYLKYVLAINSEPYFNNVKDKAIMYEGSVGKIMPIIYIKGVKSHIGDPYAGVSPSMILANIQRKTELNPKMCDVYNQDATPPPIWVHLKDRKKVYDASIPEAAVGFFNWLTFTKQPTDIINDLKSFCFDAMDQTISEIEMSYKQYCRMNNDKYQGLEYEPEVLTFSDAYKLALEENGETFEKQYQEELVLAKEEFQQKKITLPEVAVKLIEFTVENLSSNDPLIIIGLSGPFYPHINNQLLEGGERYNLENRVNEIASRHYSIKYQSNQYFMGISDLSYCGFVGNIKDIEAIKENSPGWDDVYKIPFEKLRSHNMQVVNIGPWGKDLHKTTERVYGPDVFTRVPTIIFELINEILEV
ncbi:M20/M25/M40 family metallo-hydrolase [Proteinivorax hydrogeniformans]|uniref:M20/M25/M40 family metallo-hydrolase n=1 Tax=Proteinivorax hydrogeniformans TaxID=1826727 RepID=A0AAU8HSZ5_9FIRM